MISDKRKKVLLDLFGHPLTIFPTFIGMSSAALAWAFESSMLGAVSFFSLLGGIGFTLTRLLQSGHEIIDKQKKYEHEQKLEEEKRHLDALDKKLVKDRDPRTQSTLREIRKLYYSLRDDIDDGEVSSSGYRLLETVESLFHACVELLEESYDTHCLAMVMAKGTEQRDRLKKERDKKVEKCIETTSHLREAIKKFRELKGEKGRKTIDALRADLDRQIEVARKVGAMSISQNEAEEAVEFESFMNEG